MRRIEAVCHDVAKLLDFRSGKNRSSPPSIRALDNYGQEGTITGSPLYMSPEQAIGEVEPDHRSDIYSLGAVAYFMVTGRPPFEGEKPIRIILAHAHDKLVSPRTHCADLSKEFAEIIERCLEKKPEDRFQSVDELSASLAAIKEAIGWSFQDARQWWLSHPVEPSCIADDARRLTNRSIAQTGEMAVSSCSPGL